VPRPKILIVDDEPFNVDFLEQELDDLGYDTVAAVNGQEALERVRTESPDLVLLDIMMPIMDGFTVLGHLKADAATQDIPVIIISAMTDLQSVVKGIQAGADDYLPKPFEPVVLRARISTGLDRKLRRDRELEYLRQVECLTAAAQSVEASAYDEATIAPVAARPDALGNLARVFQRMAQEVVAREQRLKQQLRQLQLDIEEQRSSAADTAAIYIPMDRRQALAGGTSLPELSEGAALFADISGFTPLTESFARELGLQRGAEEITRQVNRVHTVLIDSAHRYAGSVVSLGGDAITCWFEGDPGPRAVACALAIQDSMQQFAQITAPGGMLVSIGVKVAVAAGQVRRLLVGDPRVQVIDALAGHVVDDLAEADRHAKRGEVIATGALANALGDQLVVSEWRADGKFALIAKLASEVCAVPWPAIPAGTIDDERSRAWLPPAVYEKVQGGQSAFLSELRPVAALFLRFGGIDYDNDPEARAKLDAFVRWVQSVAARHDGLMLQVAIRDQGCYAYITFGAPIAHYDDATRAVRAALQLQSRPAEFAYVTGVAAGVTYGPMRAGAYGSSTQRAYTVIGDKTNLAARLMMAAAANTALCDETVYEAARDAIIFEPLTPISVKGKSHPIAVYKPVAERSGSEGAAELNHAMVIDRLAPADQLALKTASVIGRVFSFEVLRDVYPDETDRQNVAAHVESLLGQNLIAAVPDTGDSVYTFVEAAILEAAYSQLLFAQRRQLHRAIAEWHERTHAANLAPHFPSLARHWRAADEPTRAIHYLEKAGELARRSGAYEEAQRYLSESLAIDTTASVLSSSYALAPGIQRHD
jgi:DNA-binding response OmpR family regulator